MSRERILREPVVITGIGLIAANGLDRESVWQAVRRGESRFRPIRGLRGIPDDEFIGAVVDWDEPLKGRIKLLPMCERAADEAIQDARLDLTKIEPHRFGCMANSHLGATGWYEEQAGFGPQPPWCHEWRPDTAAFTLAYRYGAQGPRLSHATACASSLMSVVSAARSIRDGQCDVVLAGGGDMISSIFVAGFDQMRVVAKDDDPQRACRPFDKTRKGFVFGEGAAFFIVERLGHALRRGARIYAEISATKMLAQAHHVTALDAESSTLVHLMNLTFEAARVAPADVGYVNAHGTGTQQNDTAEAIGIRRAFGADLHHTCVSATKSILGHTVNASGAIELAITALAMRDGFAPPTLNLTDPDPECTFDCLPLVGRVNRFQHALKISLAFGGHLVAVLLSRWNDASSGFSYPALAKAA